MWLEDVARLLAARSVRRIAPTPEFQPASVLVPLYAADRELWMVVTRRSADLPHHAGQYSFPGGVREDGDENGVATALREAHEEIGIDPAKVLVLGELDDVPTPTGFVITPVVGAIPFPTEFTLQPDEVEAVVPVPFSFVANPAFVEYEERQFRGIKVTLPVYGYRGHRIWGATARIIADLVGRITAPAAPAGE